MKKKIVMVLLAVCMVVSMAFVSMAGTKNNIGVKEFARLQNVMKKVTGKECRVVNYQKISNAEWMVRIDANAANPNAAAIDRCSGDYRVVFVNTEEEAKARASKCWFYVGVYDDMQHDLHGFAVATREYRKDLNQFYTYSQPDNAAILEIQ